MFHPQLFLRSIIIFSTTILIATLVTSLFLSSANNSYFSFNDVFLTGLGITGLLSTPNILLLFVGISYLYSKNNKWKYIRIRLVLLWFLLCVLPLLFFYLLDLFNIIKFGLFSFGKEMVLLATPYMLFALIFLLLINYLFDKKIPLNNSNAIMNDDELLDDTMIIENEN